MTRITNVFSPVKPIVRNVWLNFNNCNVMTCSLFWGMLYTLIGLIYLPKYFRKESSLKMSLKRDIWCKKCNENHLCGSSQMCLKISGQFELFGTANLLSSIVSTDACAKISAMRTGFSEFSTWSTFSGKFFLERNRISGNLITYYI